MRNLCIVFTTIFNASDKFRAIKRIFIISFHAILIMYNEIFFRTYKCKLCIQILYLLLYTLQPIKSDKDLLKIFRVLQESQIYKMWTILL